MPSSICWECKPLQWNCVLFRSIIFYFTSSRHHRILYITFYAIRSSCFLSEKATFTDLWFMRLKNTALYYFSMSFGKTSAQIARRVNSTIKRPTLRALFRRYMVAFTMCTMHPPKGQKAHIQLNYPCAPKIGSCKHLHCFANQRSEASANGLTEILLIFDSSSTYRHNMPRLPATALITGGQLSLDI